MTRIWYVEGPMRGYNIKDWVFVDIFNGALGIYQLNIVTFAGYYVLANISNKFFVTSV